MPTLPPLPLVGPYGQAGTYLVTSAGTNAARVDNFANWARRGCNTLFVNERKEDRAGWALAARAAGLKYFLQVPFRAGPTIPTPAPDLLIGEVDYDQIAKDDADPNCLGWAFPDEYDDTNRVPLGAVSSAQKTAAVIRARSNKPIFWNFTGQGPGLGGAYNPGPVQDRVRALLACCDIVGFDFHLYATGRTPFGPATSPGDPAGGFGVIWLKLMDLLARLAPGKPVVVCVESGHQGVDLPGTDRPGPTAPQYEEMVRTVADYAAAKGYPLGGVMIFPQQIRGDGGFKYDSTPPEVAAAMKGVHAKYLAQAPAPADPVQVRLAAVEDAVKGNAASMRAGLGAIQGAIAKFLEG